MSRSHLARQPSAARQRGLTLVETMVTLGISAVLISVAVPSLVSFIARKRVANVANELASDLRYLRSISLQRGLPTQIEFNANAAISCYVIATDAFLGGGQTCNCTLPTPCGDGPAAPVVARLMSLQQSGGVTVSSMPVKTVFGSNGLPAAGATMQATVQSSAGGTARVFTNAVGRPFVCSVAGQQTNFPAC